MGRTSSSSTLTRGLYRGLGKFGEFFPSGHQSVQITELVSSAGIEFPKDPLEGMPYIEARKYKSSQTGICDLPCELQDAIFAELRDPVDVVAFCLTASHFWRVGLSHYKALYMDYISHAGDWSGDRLICVGGNAEDWPEGLISDEELEKLKASYPFSHLWTPNISSLFHECSQSLWDLRWPPQYEFSGRCKLEIQNPWLVNSLPLYRYDFSAWLNLFREAFSIYDLGKRGPYVLRNLSKKVYVRQNALALKSGTDASVYYMSFGSLVLARIAWSTDSGMAMAYATDHDMHRGAWAGDRFDVVRIKAIKHDDDWTDVSPAAMKELSEIWESEFGRGWEDTVRKRGL
ncbi:hypothetical protein BDZ89DRAFT_1134015 [Hymenopellis radicata]|nr:hypothetical protein BDZ89DRAFT_1134015 [Hymenopellis radicata]